MLQTRIQYFCGGEGGGGGAREAKVHQTIEMHLLIVWWAVNVLAGRLHDEFQPWRRFHFGLLNKTS